MYLGQENGIEASVFTGFDFNTENEDTNYKTGTQFTIDGTLAQHFPLFGGIAGVGANEWWYEQLDGDSGSGAKLGDFKGRSVGVGPAISWSKRIGGVDLITELKWLPELSTRNRLEGSYTWLKVVLKV